MRLFHLPKGIINSFHLFPQASLGETSENKQDSGVDVFCRMLSLVNAEYEGEENLVTRSLAHCSRETKGHRGLFAVYKNMKMKGLLSKGT